MWRSSQKSWTRAWPLGSIMRLASETPQRPFCAIDDRLTRGVAKPVHFGMVPPTRCVGQAAGARETRPHHWAGREPPNQGNVAIAMGRRERG